MQSASSEPAGGPSDLEWRLGILVLVLGLVGWGVVLVANSAIPSPARETLYAEPNGRARAGGVNCHGMSFADGTFLWSVCQRVREMGEKQYLGRFDPSSGRSTLLGPLPRDAFGIRGAVIGPDGSRVLLVSNTLVEVHANRIGTLAVAMLPLGFARVGDGVELVDRTGAGAIAVTRFEHGRRVARREFTGVHVAAPGRVIRPVRAFFDEGRWHLLYEDHPREAPSLPLEVSVRAWDERGVSDVVGTVQMATGVVRDDDGVVTIVDEWLEAGAIVGAGIGSRETYVLRGSQLVRVAFPGSPFVDVITAFANDGPHARLAITDISEHTVWLDGSMFERIETRERFAALRHGGRVGPVIAASFWMEPGFRIVPLGRDGYLLLGSLGGSYVRLGSHLARLDSLSIFERFARLFVEDRAKRNSDLLLGLGVLRVATVPLVLAGPIAGLAVLALRRNRPRTARVVGASWLVLAVLGSWHFAYVLRYFW